MTFLFERVLPRSEKVSKGDQTHTGSRFGIMCDWEKPPFVGAFHGFTIWHSIKMLKFHIIIVHDFIVEWEEKVA